MNLIDIAIYSIKRQKTKKVFLFLAIILSTASVISFYVFIEIQKISIVKQFEEYGANIVITPKADNLSLSYGGINVGGLTANMAELKLADIARIWQIPNKKNIRSVSPKLLGAVETISNNNKNMVLMSGVFFTEEIKVKNWWELTGKYPQKNNEIIAGSDAAVKLGLKENTELEIKGKKLKVSGILKPTGGQDDEIIFANYDLTAKLLDKDGAVTLTEVSALCSDCPIDTIIEQITSVLPTANIKGIKQIMKQKMDTISQFEKFALIITGIIITFCTFLIFISMMGSISDRKQEIGVYRAIGFKKGDISTIILTESLIVCAIAGFIGLVSGYLISYLLLPIATEIDWKLIRINFFLITAAQILIIIIGQIASLYPARKAADIDPVMTLNSL